MYQKSLDIWHEILEKDDPSRLSETLADDVVINGIDMLTFNSDGLISEFKVMVRPLQAMQMLHTKMDEMLEKLKG